MMQTRFRTVGALVSILAIFVVGLWIGKTEKQTRAETSAPTTSTVNITFNSEGQPSSIDMSQFWKAWATLDQNFVQVHASTSIPTDQQKLYGAIAGLAESYGDPYTVFFPPQDAKVFNEDVSGSFGGVGMEIDNNQQGQLVVISPLKGSPSEAAGIQSGDIVLFVDATSTVGMASNQAIKIIRGPKGTTVKLTIQRKGSTKPIVVSIVRDTINIPTINAYKRPDGIFTIELYSFSANSANLFRDALRQFVQSGSHKLILDLRGNPGGYLEAAVNMASFFLPVGNPIVTEDFKGKQNNIVNRSYGYNVFADDKLFKMAILVNQGSASASEILAGALQQNNVAKLVGTRTFGKGSVQELVELGGGAELKITIARWLTPNGSSISDGGLQPDISAERTQDNRTAGIDPQTDAAAQYLNF